MDKEIKNILEEVESAILKQETDNKLTYFKNASNHEVKILRPRMILGIAMMIRSVKEMDNRVF